MSADEDSGLLQDLLGVLPREALAPSVQALLGVTVPRANAITRAFDRLVATPLKRDLVRLHGSGLAKREPMIYTARGTVAVDEWVDRVLEEAESRAMEAHLGRWLEEVARIVSGGIEAESGVGLRIEDDRGVHLYAIQATPRSWKADVSALRKAAARVRGGERDAHLYIAVLSGRTRTGPIPAVPDVSLLDPDDFWLRVGGIADFRARLLKASIVLSALVDSRIAEEVVRIKSEANALYGDPGGALDLDLLAAPPPRPRLRRGGEHGLDAAGTGPARADDAES